MVDYTDPLVEERLAGLSEGATVRLELAPAAADTRSGAVSAVRHRTMTDGGSSVDEDTSAIAANDGSAGSTYVVTRVIPGTAFGIV